MNDPAEQSQAPAITRVLQRLAAGDVGAADELAPLVYEELRELAAARVAMLAPGRTLQATALVHEAWVRLGGREAVRWDDRAHFFGAASRAMRQILVDEARRRQRDKRGGGWRRVALEDGPIASESDAPAELDALDRALDQLESEHPRPAQVVMLRYFAGCSWEEIAEMVGTSVRTAERDWNFARVWLYRVLNEA